MILGLKVDLINVILKLKLLSLKKTGIMSCNHAIIKSDYKQLAKISLKK